MAGGGQFLGFMEGHSCYEGDIKLMGGPPSQPTRENTGYLRATPQLSVRLVGMRMTVNEVSPHLHIKTYSEYIVNILQLCWTSWNVQNRM